MMKRLLILTLLVLCSVGLFARFWQLESIPIAYYHDELDHVITGEAIARFGTDLGGSWRPAELRPAITLNRTAELASVFHAGVQSFFGFGPQSGHLPNALFGVATIGAIALLAWLLTKQKNIALMTGILVLVSPWHIYISRLSYEATISLFWQLLFLCGLIALHQAKRWKRYGIMAIGLVTMTSFWLAIFTYHGAKLTMLMIAIISVGWSVSQAMKTTPRRFHIPITAFIALLLILGLVSFTWWQKAQGYFGSRSDEFIWSQTWITKSVDEQRRRAVDFPADRLLLNKPVIVLQTGLQRYLSVFDVYRLGVSGYEGGFQFSLMIAGFFTLSSIAFMLFGLLQSQALKTYRSLFFLWLLSSPITSAVTQSTQSIFRSGLTYLLLYILAAIGISALYNKLQKNHSSLPFALILCTILIGEAGFFTSQYFLRYPLASADNQYFFEKLLAGYIRRVDKKTLVVVEGDAYSKARSLVAYNQLMPSMDAHDRSQFQDTTRATYQVGSTTITADCPDLTLLQNSTHVVEPGQYTKCHYEDFLATQSAALNLESSAYVYRRGLASALDSHSYFWVVNDSVCTIDDLLEYVHRPRLRDLQVLELNNQDFCRQWVIREAIVQH